ncbi:MAG: hypothetical protein ACXAC7_21180, partial [Candidatus Hodarchaeales archaeon]
KSILSSPEVPDVTTSEEDMATSIQQVSSMSILDEAEERGEVQRVWDDNVIELTTRIRKFNLMIDPKDYELLSAVLNYSKISPDKLTNLVRGLVKQFYVPIGPETKKTESKKTQIIPLEAIEGQILAHYQPYKDQWEALRRMPSKIGSMGRKNFLHSYRLNSLTLIDWDSGMNPYWHNIISKLAKSFVQTLLAIQQLSSRYFVQRFEADSLTQLIPMVNRYVALATNEAKRLRSEEKGSDSYYHNFATLIRHITEWWMILETYNRVVGRQYHLENAQLLEDLFFDYSNDLRNQEMNFTSTDIITFTTIFTDAFRLLSFSEEKVNILILLRSKLAEILANSYFKLAEQQGMKLGNIESHISFYYGCFYYTNLSPEKPITLLKNILESYPEETPQPTPSGIASSRRSSNRILLGVYILELQILTILLTYLANDDEELQHQALLIFSQAYQKSVTLEIPTKQKSKLINLFDILLFHPMEKVTKAPSNLLLSLNIPDLLKKLIDPSLVRPFSPLGRGRIKYTEEIAETIGCNLSVNQLTSVIDNLFLKIGLEKKEEKKQVSIYRGTTKFDLKIEISSQIIPKGTNGSKSVLILTYRWNENHTFINKLVTWTSSLIICAIITQPQYQKLDDHAFIVTCTFCDFQLNILKKGGNPYVIHCKHCNTNVLIHPRVYKPAQTFMENI